MLAVMDVFKTHFVTFPDQYTVIGGMACDLLMSDAGLDFRLTQDVDMVLVVEALTTEFVTAFWQFIEDGGYTNAARSTGEPEFYRFLNPTIPNYPKMIELFSRPQRGVQLRYGGHLMPLHIDNGVPSLSAILLNDDYYRFLLQGRVQVEDITVLDALHIIPLKMKAWFDLTAQKAAGRHVNDRDLRKHRLDVFRLFTLVSPDARVNAPITVLDDIHDFIDRMHTTTIGLEAIGISRNKDSILDLYETIYQSE